MSLSYFSTTFLFVFIECSYSIILYKHPHSNSFTPQTPAQELLLYFFRNRTSYSRTYMHLAILIFERTEVTFVGRTLKPNYSSSPLYTRCELNSCFRTKFLRSNDHSHSKSCSRRPTSRTAPSLSVFFKRSAVQSHFSSFQSSLLFAFCLPFNHCMAPARKWLS